MGQLAKQIVDKSSSTFGVNTEQNPKEECKAVMTRGRMATMIEDGERRIEDTKQEPVCELGEEEEEDDQLRETPIIVNKKEINVEEKEGKEKEKQKEKEKEKKRKKMKMKKRVRKRRREKLRVSWLLKRRERLVHLQGKRCHILWYS